MTTSSTAQMQPKNDRAGNSAQRDYSEKEKEKDDTGRGSSDPSYRDTTSLQIDSSHDTVAFQSTGEPDSRDPEAPERLPSGPPYSVFPTRQKQYIIFMTAWGSFFSPLSSNIYFPALNTLAKYLKVSSGVINLTVTSYMIFQGLAPTIFGDLGDLLGRRPAYILGFIIYLGANIGFALQKNYVVLFILRCLQSTGSSGTVALGNGVVGDIATSGERGKYMGYAQFGLLTGPALAPVLGGIISRFLGWRAIFWFLTIATVFFMIPFGIAFQETGRSVVGNGSIAPQGWNLSVLNYLKLRQEHERDEISRTTSRQERRVAQAELAHQPTLRWPNPMKTLHVIAEKDVSTILLYNSLGLCFIPLGIGCTSASIAGGYLMDFNYRRCAKNAGLSIHLKRGDNLQNFPLEKARIQVIWPLLFLSIVATLAYGWALEKNAPLAVPLVLQFLIGFSFTGSYGVMSSMLVDLYPYSPAPATAANNLVRCLMGAVGTAVVIQMIDGMGRGWCFTLLAAVVFSMSPLLWVETKWGPQWREERRVRVRKREQGTGSTNSTVEEEQARDGEKE